MVQGLLRTATLLLLAITLLSSSFGTYHFFKWLNPSKDLQTYITYLEGEAWQRGHSVNFRTVAISIVDDIPVGPDGVIGVCMSHPLTMQKTILLLDRFWVTATDSARKALLLHELGHCYFLLGHDDTNLNVMSSSMTYRTKLTPEMLDAFFKKAYPYKALQPQQD